MPVHIYVCLSVDKHIRLQKCTCEQHPEYWKLDCQGAFLTI